MRIRPLAMSDWSPKILAKLADIGRVSLDAAGSVAAPPAAAGEETPSTDAARKRPPSMLQAVAHHPDLVEPFLDFATVIAHQGVLSRQDSELLALRVAWNCQSEFEWGHHVDYARDAGLSPEEIARVPSGADASGWSACQRVLLRAADELHRNQQVSDAVWAELAAEYTEQQLVELLFVVGQYTMLSMVVNAAGVELEAGFEPLPAVSPGG